MCKIPPGANFTRLRPPLAFLLCVQSCIQGRLPPHIPRFKFAWRTRMSPSIKAMSTRSMSALSLSYFHTHHDLSLTSGVFMHVGLSTSSLSVLVPPFRVTHGSAIKQNYNRKFVAMSPNPSRYRKSPVVDNRGAGNFSLNHHFISLGYPDVQVHTWLACFIMSQRHHPMV
ncbi:hypothetical protein PAXRUDRAFT_476450 [Paxillus rubicundulus Ve08.2h10]|uniref:Uncharacterized protein n=1 Tax=Paxillus rubicundulus Ve08.2h10 TaxID=930991 RepID=A0A0D0DWE6_9AGAM|nr:hypothetical protein PAXRUDRAFT_476450 [Paxillus rubicundulus Ve08.2h10]